MGREKAESQPVPFSALPAVVKTFLVMACSQDTMYILLRWPNTVFARALADAIQRVHKDCKNKHAVDTVIILFAQYPLYLCYFSS